MGIIMAQGARLVGGFFRAGDDVLLFDRLDPESRREVCQVGDNCDKRAPRINLRPALANLPIKVRDYGDKQVCWLFPPELLEQSHQWPVENSDCGLEQSKKLSATKRPAILQHDVVLLLDTDAGEFAKDVQTVRKILKLNKFQLPVALLLRNHGLQSDRRVAMPSSTIMEDDVDFFHRGDCAIGFGRVTRAHPMPCG